MASTTRESAELHATSRWAEPQREDGLTLWEVNRRPRVIERNDRRIRCSTKSLNPHLRCAICLGYLKETTIVMVCLHRFCSECINKCIRLGMKECPNCRKFIPSRRSLRKDVKFDQIVKSMVGDPEICQLSEDQRGKSDANRMVHLQRAIDNNHVAGRSRRSTEVREEEFTAHERIPKKTYIKESPLIEIELRRHAREEKVDRLVRPFVTIRGDATISIIKTFLKRKLEDKEYEITSESDDASVVLDDAVTLFDAKKALHVKAAVMVLKYKSIESTDDIADGTDTAALEDRKMPHDSTGRDDKKN